MREVAWVVFDEIHYMRDKGNSSKQCHTYDINPFAPGDFAEKCVLKLVEWFSGHCHAIKS